MASITVEARYFFEPRLWKLKEAIATGRIAEGMEMVLIPARVRWGAKPKFYLKDKFGNPLEFDFLEFPTGDCSTGSPAFYTIAAIRRMAMDREVTVDLPFRPLIFRVPGETGLVDIFCADQNNEPVMLLDSIRGQLTVRDYPVKIRRGPHPRSRVAIVDGKVVIQSKCLCE